MDCQRPGWAAGHCRLGNVLWEWRIGLGRNRLGDEECMAD